MKREESDFSFESWVPIRALPDLIPVIGAVAWTERERRDRRLSIREFYFGSLRDSEWPVPRDERALTRATLLALRNVSFAAYHVFSPLVIASFLQGK